MLLSEATYQGPKLQERKSDMWQLSATAECDKIQLYLQIGVLRRTIYDTSTYGEEPARVGR